jgi:hypothetical protein
VGPEIFEFSKKHFSAAARNTLAAHCRTNDAKMCLQIRISQYLLVSDKNIVDPNPVPKKFFWIHNIADKSFGKIEN